MEVKMPDIMDERRRERRLDEIHETTISIISLKNNLPKEKIFDNYCNDISSSGTRIRTNSLLPVDTLLQMDIKFDDMQQMMTTMAKVKWSKVIINDTSCEAGVEFYPHSEVTQIHMMPLLYLYSDE
jgi:hypothetical protein